MNAAERLATFVRNLVFDSIPDDVVQNIKFLLIDSLGNALAAYKHDFAEKIVSTGRRWGRGESTIIGYGDKLAPPNAALVNSSLCHGLDYDDTYFRAIVHLSSVVVPAALAVAEKEQIDGKRLMAAMAAGYEIMTRVSRATYVPRLSTTSLQDRGFMTISTCGSFGAAAASAKLLDLGPGEIVNALGISGSFASGIGECLINHETVQLLFPGWAAHTGISAAQLAAAGFTAPSTIFEGKYGFFESHVGAGNYNLDVLTEGLGDVWETMHTAFKPHPCCHLLTAPVDAALEIKQKNGIDLVDIKAVEVGVEQYAMRFVGTGAKLPPENVYSAKFNLPWTVAAALVRGKVSPSLYAQDKLGDPMILSLAGKVSCFEDQELTAYVKKVGKQTAPAVVRITTKQGRTYEHRDNATRGMPENPMTKDQMVAKFEDNAANCLDRKQIKGIIGIVDRLEAVQSIREVMDLCKA